MKEQTLAQWKEEMKAKFSKRDEISFVCPSCGHIASVKDMCEAGGTGDNAPQMCIGRINGKGEKSGKDMGFGCLWAAFGLLGTMGKGRKLFLPDGSTCEVFEFADKKEMEAPQNEITQA